jgi:hypothetical protein
VSPGFEDFEQLQAALLTGAELPDNAATRESVTCAREGLPDDEPLDRLDIEIGMQQAMHARNVRLRATMSLCRRERAALPAWMRARRPQRARARRRRCTPIAAAIAGRDPPPDDEGDDDHDLSCSPGGTGGSRLPRALGWSGWRQR